MMRKSLKAKILCCATVPGMLTDDTACSGNRSSNPPFPCINPNTLMATSSLPQIDGNILEMLALVAALPTLSNCARHSHMCLRSTPFAHVAALHNSRPFLP